MQQPPAAKQPTMTDPETGELVPLAGAVEISINPKLPKHTKPGKRSGHKPLYQGQINHQANRHAVRNTLARYCH